MSLLLLALAAGSTPDASSLPTLLVGVDLFPTSALAAKESGTSILVFDIMPNGAVANCNVIESAGFSDLDSASCSLATRRQQFAPHQGNDAIPMKEAVRWASFNSGKSAWNGAIPISPETWVTAADYPSSALQARHQGTVKIKFDVTESGVTQNCEVVASSGDADLDAATCHAVVNRANLLPAVDAQGRPCPTQAQLQMRWQIPPTPTGMHHVVFDGQSGGSICYIQQDEKSRLLTPAICNNLANAVSEAGGDVNAGVNAQLPDPIPYALPN